MYHNYGEVQHNNLLIRFGMKCSLHLGYRDCIAWIHVRNITKILQIHTIIIILQVTINALWLLPLRLIFIVLPSILMGALVCTLALCGCDRFNEDNPQPLNRWGR